MPADRLLATLLRALQTPAQQQDTPRLLGTAVSLLTTLNNPLNVTLLTSQLLAAPAIWLQPDGLRTSLSFLGVFNSATIRTAERERASYAENTHRVSTHPQFEPTMPLEEWVLSVIKGADERSSRSRHLLVLGGLLIGFGSQEEEHLSTSLQPTLEGAFVTAANLALAEARDTDELSQANIALILNHAFPHLADQERARIDYDRLLPILMHCTLHSTEGLGSAYFVGVADADVRQISEKQFKWDESSSSYGQVQRILTGPLISALGPLSRLIAHTVENVRDSWLVLSVTEDIAEFSQTLLVQWRQNKLSEIDVSEEPVFLDEETRKTTVPTLWKLLRSTLYGLVIVLRSVVGRQIGDAVLAADDNAPHLAQETLRSLRSLYFISARLGSSSFSQYTFTYLAAIDILCNYPPEAESFVRSAAPTEMGHIPSNPLDRCLDLFFLNTAEHYTLVLSPAVSENLLIAASVPYLAAGGNPYLISIFEAAHSVMLAVFSAPQNVEITSKHLPFYVGALFRAFPENLSSRQFRLAFKNLLRITSPPSTIATAQPLLAPTLLELIYDRALQAPTTPLPTNPTAQAMLDSEPTEQVIPVLSEQAVLVLTLLDSLPTIAYELLDEWLPLSATLVNRIADLSMREHCRQHFWHIMTSGEMDSERSQTCVAWWTTKGGREELVFGDEQAATDKGDEFMMSGALPDGCRTSKL